MKLYLITSKIYMKLIKWMIYQMVPINECGICPWCKKVKKFLKELEQSIAEDC